MKFHDLFRVAAVAALAVSLAVSPAAAKAGGNGKAKAPVAKPKAPKAPGGSAAASAKAKPPKAKASAPKAKTSGSASAKSGGSAKSAQSRKGNDPTPAISATDPADTKPLDPTLPLSKAQEKLLKNDNLRAKMQARLPNGPDVMTAASGFKNLGQFVAAVNVSNNLGIDFRLLKSLMVGPERLSLGQAIQRAKALDAATATTVATTALADADAELAATPSTALSTKKNKPRN